MTPALLCALLLAAQAQAQAQTSQPPSKLGEEDAAPAVQTPAADPLADIATALNPTLGENERVAAVKRLGGSSDERVLSILLTLAQDRSRNIHVAAVQSIGEAKTPRAQELLVGIVKEPRNPFASREEAIKSLHPQGLENAPAVLESIATDTKLPGSLSSLARTQLETHYPSQAATAAPTPAPIRPVKSSPDRALPTVLGAGFGGYTLWTVGVLGQREGGGALGMITGLALGGAAGYLLAPDLTPTQTTFYGTATGLGTWVGLGIGLAALQNVSEDRFLHLFGIGGELLGATAGYLLWDSMKLTLDAPDATSQAAYSLTGAMLGIPALHLLASLDNPRQGVSGSNDLLAGSPFFKFMALGSGLALGGGVGTLAGRYFGGEDRGGYIATGTAWGLGLGALGSAVALPSSTLSLQHVEAFGLLGGIAGLGVAAATWSPELQGGDLLTLNTFGLTGAATGLGIVSLMTGSSDTQAAAALVSATSAIGLISGRVFTRSLEFKGSDTSFTGLLASHGFLSGLLLPDFFGEVEGRQRAGGALLGGSAGLITGVLLSQHLDLPAHSIGTMFLADFFGSLGGWGVGLLATPNATLTQVPISAGVLLGGTAGMIGAGLLADKLEVDTGDGLLIPLSTLVGLWNGVALSAGITQEGRQIGGAALLGAGLGGLSGLALSQLLTLTPGAVAAAGSGSLWGLYLAGSTLFVSQKQFEQTDFLVLIAASDIGLGITSALLSPAIGVRPEQIGVASLFGVGGAASFVLGAMLFTREDNTQALSIANIAGGVVGLGVGAFVASRMQEAPATGNTVAAASGSGFALGALPVRFQGFSSGPLVDGDGRMSGASLVALFQND